MKFDIERDDLAEALAVTSRVAGGRLSAQIAGGLLMRTNEAGLQLVATDQDLTVRTTLDMAAQPSDAIQVAGRVLHDVVRSMPPGRLTLETSGMGLTLTNGQSRIELTAAASDSYPEPAPVQGPSFAVDASDFRDALRQVLRSASSDPSRAIFTGVQLKLMAGGKLELVTTDTYRLSVRTCTTEKPVDGVASFEGGEADIVVPARLLSELQRVLTGKHSTVGIGFDERSIDISYGPTWYHSPRLMGSFPEWRKLLPPSYDYRLVVNRQAILDSLRRVRAMDKDSNQSVRIGISGNSVTIESTRSEIGAVEDQLESAVAGESPSLLFTPQYLAEGIEAAEGEMVTIEFLDSTKPALITGDDPEQFRYLVMPIKSPV